MKKLIDWCKDNIGGVAILFFLAFIPLYPKLPLINVIRTWVYIRLEDFLVAAAIGIYLLTKLWGRRIPKSPLTWPIVVYWIVGIVSAAYSIAFIGPKLTGYFPHLVILHFLRRIEYMMLFFMAFDVIVKNRAFVTKVIWTLAATTVGIIVYGLGQKLMGWPAFLTMNEEFAKGIPLRLPPTARIPSTFSGHYDLAAFMVLTIPILVTLVFAVKKLWQKIVFFLLSFGALMILLLTESRTSFLVYLAGITATLIWYKKKLWIIPVIIVSFFMLNFVKGASDRFYKTFRYNDVIVDLSTGKPVGTLASLEGGTAIIKQSESPAAENLPTGSQYIGIPASPSGQLKTISYTSVSLASGSGEIATVSGSFLIQKALVYDISITTRLQAEWPNALSAFKRNLLLGSGYSTLSVASDGDYIRMLGETGILGTLGFLGILLASFVLFFKRKETLEGTQKAFVVGVFGGLTGLMFNAILIDVFEASKVAFSLWLLLGVAVAVLGSVGTSLSDYLKLMRRALTSHAAYITYLVIAAVVLFGSSVSNYFIGDDFTWLKWAASSTFADVPKYFTQATGFFYRPIPKLVYFVLYALFWLKPEGYHVVSILLFGLASALIYLTLIVLGVKRILAFLSSFLFAVLAIHHENVFWISGLSTLIASVFLFAAAYLLVTKKYFFALVATVLSMFSYDGMLVAPLIFFILLPKRTKWSYLVLLLTPAYWFVRVTAGAVSPSGDYGYRLSTLPFNVIGNGIGYIVGTFAGPRFIEFWSTVRDFLRVQRVVAAVSGGALTLSAAWLLWHVRGHYKRYKRVIVWVLSGLLSLAAYVGLGNMSERYALTASGFFVIGLGVFVSTLWKLNWKYLFVAVIGALIIWNGWETVRIGGDWNKAASVSQETLSIMNRQFFPLRENKDFIFVNPPIKYGRAWVFPTGLNDALWHIFRFNPWAYMVTNMTSADAAYSVPVPRGFTPEIFVFEDYHLKRLMRIVK